MEVGEQRYNATALPSGSSTVMDNTGRWVGPQPVCTGAQKRQSLVLAGVRAVNLPGRSKSLTECAIPAPLSSPVI
jgi:hypothetical protein